MFFSSTISWFRSSKSMNACELWDPFVVANTNHDQVKPIHTWHLRYVLCRCCPCICCHHSCWQPMPLWAPLLLLDPTFCYAVHVYRRSRHDGMPFIPYTYTCIHEQRGLLWLHDCKTWHDGIWKLPWYTRWCNRKWSQNWGICCMPSWQQK